MNHLLLVDGHSILNRAFYGVPDLTNSKGQHTNAVLGFFNMLMKVMDEVRPTHLAVAFDLHAPTFRHKMYAAYKGTRKGMPEELLEQVPLVKELLQTMQVTILELEGYEADDIIGTMSVRAEEAGMEVTVLSGDRDLLQLATEHVMIQIPKTKGGHTTVEKYYASDVAAYYGVTPREFIDMKGLMGDTSDNIPGVPGIGEKTAGKIIATYHSIEEAYAHLQEIKPKKAKENLEAYYGQAQMSKELATICLSVPLETKPESLCLKNLFTDEAYQTVKRLEMKSILKYFDGKDVPASLPITTRVIAELDEAEQLFHRLGECDRAGVFCFSTEEELVGVGFVYEKDHVDFMQCTLFVNAELICDRLTELYDKHPDFYLITGDLKKMMRWLPLPKRNRVFDTSVAAYLLNPTSDSYAYDAIAAEYLSVTLPSEKELFPKGHRPVSDRYTSEELSYIGYASYVPYAAWDALAAALQKAGEWTLYETIELPTVYVLRHMEKEGIRVDAEALKEYGDMLGAQIEKLETAIYQEAGGTFNINSPKQLGEVLFDRLKLPGAKKTKTGYSTNADILNRLRADYPIVSDVLDYRQAAKLKSTYADGLSVFIREDERIYGTFNQTITATGRISSTEPNLQNIPMRTPLGREIRKVFIPKDGYVFADADYSQIELRVLAHCSGDRRLIQAYREDADIHALTASQVFGVPMEQVDAEMRRRAKAVNFGIVYGISAYGLAEDLRISKKEAETYIEGYFATYPGVKAFLDETVAEAKKTGMTRTLFGRIRKIPELHASNYMQRNFGERVAMNAPIQGTAADLIKLAMIRVQDRLQREGLRSSLILQIHDELLIETHMDETEQVTRILQEEMMHAAELSVPLSVSVKVGKTWYDTK